MKYSKKSYKKINWFIENILNDYSDRYDSYVWEDSEYFENLIRLNKDKIFLWADFQKYCEENNINTLTIPVVHWNKWLYQEQRDLIYEYNFYISLLILTMSAWKLNADNKKEILRKLEVAKNIYSDYIYNKFPSSVDYIKWEFVRNNIIIQDIFTDVFDVETYETFIWFDDDSHYFFLIDTFSLELTDKICLFYNNIFDYLSQESEELIDGENLMLEDNFLWEKAQNNPEFIEWNINSVFNDYKYTLNNINN